MYSFDIAYNRLSKTVDVYPDSTGVASGSQVIGTFGIDNPKASFESYREDLGEAIKDAMEYVGQPDLAGWEIRVRTWNHDTWVTVKEREAVDLMTDIPGTDIPVSKDLTIAQVAEREQSGDVEDEVETTKDKEARVAKTTKATKSGETKTKD